MRCEMRAASARYKHAKHPPKKERDETAATSFDIRKVLTNFEKLFSQNCTSEIFLTLHSNISKYFQLRYEMKGTELASHSGLN
jgi:hypothetical protein